MVPIVVCDGDYYSVAVVCDGGNCSVVVACNGGICIIAVVSSRIKTFCNMFKLYSIIIKDDFFSLDEVS